MKGGAGEGMDPAGAAFFYHRAVAPMLWVLLSLMLIETMVVHLLVALWNAWAALILSIMSLALVGWFILFLRSLKLTIPWPQVVGVRAEWTLAELRAAGLFNGGLIAHPNIVVELDPPVQTRRRSIRFLAHRLDEPSDFVAAFSAWNVAASSSFSPRLDMKD